MWLDTRRAGLRISHDNTNPEAAGAQVFYSQCRRMVNLFCPNCPGAPKHETTTLPLSTVCHNATTFPQESISEESQITSALRLSS